MALTPVPGVVRLRTLAFGKETTFKTAVAATRIMPWSATPNVNPNWTNVTADTGTLDQAIAPTARALDLTVATPATDLFSDDVPTIISAGVMGGLTLPAAGSAFTAAPASTSQDVFDTWTAEVYDDATADAWSFAGGVINDFLLDYPQDQGPIQFSSNWRFAKIASYPATPTGALTRDTNPVPLYVADTQFYVNDTAGAIGTTQLVDQVYSASFALNNNIDPKRFANGSNTRFQVQNYGRGERTIDFSITFAKATAAIAEAVKWIAASPSERFLEMRTTSTVTAGAGNKHSLSVRIPGFWFTRAEATVNSNTGFTLAGHQVYDSTLTYPFRMSSVSARAAL